MYMERKMLAFFSLENFPNRSNIVDLTPTHTRLPIATIICYTVGSSQPN